MDSRLNLRSFCLTSEPSQAPSGVWDKTVLSSGIRHFYLGNCGGKCSLKKIQIMSSFSFRVKCSLNLLNLNCHKRA